jgi:hypothetical protein
LENTDARYGYIAIVDKGDTLICTGDPYVDFID